MKIVNKRKFIRMISILLIILLALIFFSKSTYSKVNVTYKESYICNGDTLWSIANEQCIENEYFQGKDIRYIVNELKQVNNLKTCDVYVGEKIKIPTY